MKTKVNWTLLGQKIKILPTAEFELMLFHFAIWFSLTFYVLVWNKTQQAVKSAFLSLQASRTAHQLQCISGQLFL